MSNNIVGWDIGGAHLKAALLSDRGEVFAVFQEPCPLWQGLQVLEIALANILVKLPEGSSRHAITMTGELVDLFADKAQGVHELIRLMQQVLVQHSIMIYAGRSGFIRADAVAAKHSEAIASANWLASATYVAGQIEQGIFIDMGSTTTDVLLINNTQVNALGYTDYQRLISSELVYTGMVRTAVMAVAQTVDFMGNDVGVMSEYFATMADIYRLTGELDEAHDQGEAADQGVKTEQASARRLARMIGCDAQDFSISHWKKLALSIRNQQLARIQLATERQLSRLGQKENAQIVGAGIGRYLLKDIAHNLDIDYIDFNELFKIPKQQTEMQIADCAPAVAVAYLASKEAFKVVCTIE